MEGFQGWMAFAGTVVAVVAQWANSRPWSAGHTPLIKLGLAVVGLALYLPIAQPWTVGFMPWFEDAWLFALAVPGLASLIALAPGMATSQQK